LTYIARRKANKFTAERPRVTKIHNFQALSNGFCKKSYINERITQVIQVIISQKKVEDETGSWRPKTGSWRPKPEVGGQNRKLKTTTQDERISQEITVILKHFVSEKESKFHTQISTIVAPPLRRETIQFREARRNSIPRVIKKSTTYKQ
jgi:hypothetical protein